MKMLIRKLNEKTTMKPHVRALHEEDIDDVLEISKHIWGGHDYVPGVIRDWLKDPDSYTICVEVDDTVVGISNLRLIENGKTGWMEGLRVHPDFRGHGFANLLTDGLVEHAESINVPRLRYTTVVENEASMALAERAGLREVFRMIVFWAEVPQNVEDYREAEIQEASIDSLIASIDAYSEVIPQRVLIYDWKAMDLTAENLKEVTKDRTFWRSKNQTNLALSLGGHRYEESEEAWSCTIYSNNEDLARAHLHHQTQVARKKGLDIIVTIMNREFKNLVGRLSWLEDTERFRELALMERKLRK